MKHIHDIIIIGGGPGGYTAALYGARAGLDTLLLEKLAPGGQMSMTFQIDNYPGFDEGVNGYILGDKMKKGAERFGAQTKLAEVLAVNLEGEIKEVVTQNETYYGRSVILATGAATKELGLPGEKELVGRGVSYCATCDGMLYKGKTVALVGSGHEAELDVEFLRGVCKEVLHFPENKPYSVKGGMKADTISDGQRDYAVDGIFIIKDTVSVTKLVQGLEYQKGGIVVDEKMQTNIPGIFAAGDCAGVPYQLAKAAGDGNVAALSACDYLKGK